MLDFSIISTILWTIGPFALCLFLGYLIGAVSMERRRKIDVKLIRDKLDKVTQNLKPIEEALEINRSPDGDPESGSNIYNPGKEPLITRIKNWVLPKTDKRTIDLPESRTKKEELIVRGIADRLQDIQTGLKVKLEEKDKPLENAAPQPPNKEAGATKKEVPAVPPPQPPATEHSNPQMPEDPGASQVSGPGAPEVYDLGGSEVDGQAEVRVPTSDANPTLPRGLLEEVAYSYNLGVDSREARNSFWANYHTTRIGNNKAVEQRLGEVAEPEFRSLDSGNFIAIEDAEAHRYLVVPQFDMTLTVSAYNEGAVGYIFDCLGYDPEVTYRVVKVDRPAVFNSDGGNWTRVDKGQLTLQR
jgi:hypothetical protein